MGVVRVCRHAKYLFYSNQWDSVVEVDPVQVHGAYDPNYPPLNPPLYLCRYGTSSLLTFVICGIDDFEKPIKYVLVLLPKYLCLAEIWSALHEQRFDTISYLNTSLKADRYLRIWSGIGTYWKCADCFAISQNAN